MSSITEPWTRLPGVSTTANFERLSTLNTWKKYLGRTDSATGQTNEGEDLAWICGYMKNNRFLNQLVQRNLHLQHAKNLFDATWELSLVVVVCLGGLPFK